MTTRSSSLRVLIFAGALIPEAEDEDAAAAKEEEAAAEEFDVEDVAAAAADEGTEAVGELSLTAGEYSLSGLFSNEDGCQEKKQNQKKKTNTEDLMLVRITGITLLNSKILV